MKKNSSLFKSFRFWLFSFVLLYFIGTIFVIPYIIKTQALSFIHNNLNHNATLQRIIVNPFGAEIRLYNFQLSNKKNEKVLSFESLRVDFNLIKTLMTNVIEFDAISLYKPSVHVKLQKDGKINLLSLIPNNEQSKQANKQNKKSELPPLNLENINLTHTKIFFSDLTQDKLFKVDVVPLNFNVKNLNTLIDKKGIYDFNLKINKHTNIVANGSITLNPIKIKGDISLSELKIDDFWPRVEKGFNLNINKTNVNLFANYLVSMNDELNVKVSDSTLNINDINIHSKGKNKNLIKLKKLNVKLKEFDLDNQVVKLDTVLLNEFYTNFILNKDKSNNIEALFVSKDTSKKEKTNTEKNSWNVSINNIDLKNSKILFKDRSVKETFSTSLHDINLYVQNIDLKPNTKFNYQFDSKLDKVTMLKAKGDLSITPLSVNTTYDLERLPLGMFQTYLNDILNINIKSADFYTKGLFKLQEKTNKIFVQANSSVKNIDIKQKNSTQSLVKMSQLNINELNFSQLKNALTINSIDLVKPYVKVHIDKNKKTNFSNIVKNSTSSTNKKTQNVANRSNKEFLFDLGPIHIKNGSMDFTDLSLPLPFSSFIESLEGKVSELSSHSSKPSDILINGVIDKYGMAKINGSLDYKNIEQNTKVTMLLKNIATKNLTPYSSEFIGRKINGGKLTLDLNYKIIESKLDATNNIIIHKIELGEIIKSENSISVPIDLAIALLEDSNGVIDLSLPITGDINDPEFKIGSIIGQALSNLLVKIVTSPFSFLGSLLGVESDELKFVDFEAGQNELLPPAKESLDTLVKAFIKRPTLALQLEKTYNKQMDTQAIKINKHKNRLNNIIKNLKKENQDEKVDTYVMAVEYLHLKTSVNEDLEEIKKTFEKVIETEIVFEKAKYLNYLTQQQIKKEEVSLKELENLAQERAVSISDYLETAHKIHKKRVVIGNFKVFDNREDKWIKSELGITVKQK